jgi:hypothetical protein
LPQKITEIAKEAGGRGEMPKAGPEPKNGTEGTGKTGIMITIKIKKRPEGKERTKRTNS